MTDSITNPQVLAALARAKKSTSSTLSLGKQSSSNLPSTSISPTSLLPITLPSQSATLIIVCYLHKIFFESLIE
jgi:hypothetical protein